MTVRLVGAAICLSAMLTAIPCAAEVDVHASLSHGTTRVGEIVELTVAVSGAIAGVNEPEIPPVDYLDVVSSSAGQSIQLMNGRMSSTSTFVFGIRASREGTYTIPPVEVRVGGQVYSTRPLTLRVSTRGGAPSAVPPAQGTPPPATAPGGPTPREVDAILEVDNKSPFVGQQVTMTLSFYQARNAPVLGDAEYTPPTTEGLVAEALPDAPPTLETIGNVPFTVVRRKTALIAARQAPEAPREVSPRSR